MSRLWRRRVSKELFFLAWLIILAGIAQGIVGIIFIIHAAHPRWR